MFLAPTTYLAAIGDDVVVLDARTGAYFCLAGTAGVVRLEPAGGVAIDDPDLTAQFAQAGWLTDTPAPARGPWALGPRRDLGGQVAERVALADLALILAAWASLFVSYHLASFHRITRRPATQRPVPQDGEPTHEVRRLVAAFERVLPWLPFQAVCLYRALLLKRVLHWRGHDARWVFGVRTWPFQAHCWLQIGDTVLDDAAERLEGFFPIMEV